MAWFAFLLSVVVVCEAPTLVSGDYMDFSVLFSFHILRGRRYGKLSVEGFFPAGWH